MPDIKTKQRPNIKEFDTKKVKSAKFKSNLSYIKDKNIELTDTLNNKTKDTDSSYENANDYAISQIQDKSKIIRDKTFYDLNEKRKEQKEKHRQDKNNKIRQKLDKKVQTKLERIMKEAPGKTIKLKNDSINNSRRIKQVAKETSNREIKTAKQSSKVAKKTTEETTKIIKETPIVVKKAVKASVKVTKATIKAIITSAKAVVTGTKALISAIAAGGVVSIAIILIVCIFGGVIAIFNMNGDKDTATMWGSDMVTCAESQLGVEGGEPYWSWYGFNERVEWCACFVCWVADQCGLLEGNSNEDTQSDIEDQALTNAKLSIPKYSVCDDGINKFKEKGEWQDRETDGTLYIPKPGDIIFFDWIEKDTGEQDRISDHTGIVKNVDLENNKVHTIEGNSGDAVKEQEYDLNNIQIVGYGTLNSY